MIELVRREKQRALHTWSQKRALRERVCVLLSERVAGERGKGFKCIISLSVAVAVAVAEAVSEALCMFRNNLNLMPFTTIQPESVTQQARDHNKTITTNVLANQTQ